MSRIEERMEELSPKRRELLARLLKKERADSSRAGGVTPRRRDGDSTPLSFAQQRLWLIDQLEPGSASYNTFVSLSLEGALDLAALDASINEIVRRHEALRTTFDTRGESPVQVIAESLKLTPTVIDLTGLPESGRDAAAARLAVEEADRPFDLRRGPLLRVALIRMTERRHVFLLAMHHIVTDGWSLDLFVKEMGSAYEAFASGRTPSLPALPVQYADFAVWQRERLRGEVLDAQLSYWRAHLSGHAGVLELPGDYARPAVMSYRGAAQALALPTALTERLKALSRREGATPFMMLLAAFDVLLWRYSGQTDILVGTAVAGRDRAETEPLIGFFVNTLVLRADLSGDPTFRELLRRVREAALGAYAHQELPFEKLVEELQPERSLSHTPLFQVMFALQSGFDIVPKLPGLDVTPFDADVNVAQFDLSLDISEDEGGLWCEMQYRTDLFEPATVGRMLEHYRTLLEGIAADPGRRVGRLPLLTEAEEREMLRGWNDTRREYPRDRCVHELFEAQAAAKPDAVAVTCAGRQLTYGELNARANQLARHLKGLGVRPETRVGILSESSIETPVALLAVLKAGGAYVALDPSYPPERLRYMMGDAGVEVLLTDGAAVGARHARVVRLDAERPLIAGQSTENAAGGAVAANLAYLVYTSGTTGVPKGILVPHCALVNTALAFVSHHRLTGRDRLLQFASLSFDVAAEEFFAAWLSGGCAVMRSGAAWETQAEFVGLLEREGVTVVNLPASFWSEWLNALDEGHSRLPESLRLVVVGNEKTLEGTLSRWRRVTGGRVEWSNAYGPTETTVTASNYEPAAGAAARGETSTVPIGRPVMNAEMYVLDAAQRLAPVGVAGELYIGGAGVARGYHKQAALTAERFVPHPFGRAGGERLYRTGDLARYLRDGNVEFLGRADEQVKLRGFRVELAEVESALSEHESVRELAVVAREDGRGGNRLVAYVVPKAGAGATAGELRRHAQKRLPDYMLPSAFVMLESLPLTPNGKLDRRALPEPAGAGGEAATAAAPPRTPVEEMLAGIWGEVLSVGRVGLTDNFFDLGGHSLLAARVVSRIRQACNVELSLRSLFEAPTVEGLAARVESKLREGGRPPLPPIGRVPRGVDPPLSFAQQRLWLLHRLEPDDTSYNMADAMRLEGRLDVPALERSFGEIVRRHEALRTTFREVDGEPVQVVAPPAPLKLETLDLSPLPPRRREGEVRRLAHEEARRPFDLSRDRPLRLRLLKLGEEEHVLLLTMHHIVSDGWSFGVMTRELSALYSAYAAGAGSPLQELPIQYADYAAWQREWLRGEALEDELEYWRGRLGGEPAALELPTDRPRPSAHTYRGAGEYLELPRELTEGLKALSRREGATLFMTLLAAFDVLLYRYTGQTDICVGVPVAGRDHAETEDLVGFFVNTLVLRADLSGDLTFRGLLAQVREHSLGAYVHQRLPFEKLVEELQPERSLSHTPLFQVMFMMQNAPGGGLQLQDVSLSEIDVGVTAAKYDLSLSMTEGEEGLVGSLIYNSDLFDASTIRRLLGHFRTLLDAIAGDPQRRLADLPLLTEAERDGLLSGFNDTRRDYPRGRCVHQLFEEQAALRPEAAALDFGGVAMSYGELNARANQLAHYLRGRGVGPEVTVGVLMGRSFELVVGMLAVLKAGGAYVPLGVNYPAARLALMLEETGARVLLTQECWRERLPEFKGEVLFVDGETPPFADEKTDDLEAVNTPHDLAYVYYTSGSTGRPKGVLATHDGVVNYLSFVVRHYELTARDVVLQMAAPTFDASARDILGTLAAGAKLVLLGDDEARDPAALLSAAEAHGVTCILSVVPPLLRGLVETAAEGTRRCETLRLILASGENLPLSECLRARGVFGEQLSIFNQYGATECTMSQTAYRVEAPGTQGVALAGRPIFNSQVFILDAHLNQCPVGVPGEVHIGGVGLARGYLSSPALTALKFIPHAYAREAGARLYKTGDLARFLPDGNVELLGRRDHQVKVRGFRVEPGEIEAALGGHENVRACVVVAREDAPGDRRLVAYVVLRRPQEPAGLRAFLKERVPEHMVPSAFVVLDDLPLTTNGKVDRAALPAPGGASADPGASFVAPRTAAEEALCRIWAEILGAGRVGIHDNFFELGGHSLLATRVMSRIRKTLHVELPLRSLFEKPTVAELAADLEPEARGELSEMEKLARILERVDELSPEEARALLEGA